ncbi:MAG: DUF692 domain-containing protein [Myxococcota bacterium]
MNALPSLGLGIGWRPALGRTIDARQDLSFVELVAENLDPRHPLPCAVRRLTHSGVKVVLHGLSLSLGGAEPVDVRRLDALARLAEATGACLVSEHAAFVRAGGKEAGHLLPLPRNAPALEALVENVRRAQAVLPVPLAIENIASLIEWPGAEMDEPEFLSELVTATGCGLLVDVANLYANALNGGFSGYEWLDAIPQGRIAYVHLAGGTRRGGLYHDTHAHPLPSGSLDLLAHLGPRARGFMLERDANFPPADELNAELDAIVCAVSAATRSAA